MIYISYFLYPYSWKFQVNTPELASNMCHNYHIFRIVGHHALSVFVSSHSAFVIKMSLLNTEIFGKKSLWPYITCYRFVQTSVS